MNDARNQVLRELGKKFTDEQILEIERQLAEAASRWAHHLLPSFHRHDTVGPILPDLPDNPNVRELRFHVRSLWQDLATTIESLNACLPLPALEPAAMWRLRQAIADATTTIAHDAEHHAQRLVDLTSVLDDHESDEGPPATTGSLATHEDDDDRQPSPLPESGGRKKLEAGSWKLEAGSWKLSFGSYCNVCSWRTLSSARSRG